MRSDKIDMAAILNSTYWYRLVNEYRRGNIEFGTQATGVPCMDMQQLIMCGILRWGDLGVLDRGINGKLHLDYYLFDIPLYGNMGVG